MVVSACCFVGSAKYLCYNSIPNFCPVRIIILFGCPNQAREVDAYFIGFTVSEGSLKNWSMIFLSVSILRATSLELVTFFVNLKKLGVHFVGWDRWQACHNLCSG